MYTLKWIGVSALLSLSGCYAYYPVPAAAPGPVYDGNPSTPAAECREFRQWVTIDGREQEAIGTACRQPDGTWKTQAQ